MTVIDTPDGIDFFQVCQHRYALDIQIHTGLKHSRGSVWKDAKTRYGLSGNLVTVRDKLAIMTEMMQQEKAKGKPISSRFAGEYTEANWDHLKQYVPLVVEDKK